MSRTLIIVATVIVVVAAAVTVWIAIHPSDEIGQAATPAPQSFDTTSGQEMKPRWNAPEGEGQGNGGADGAADN